MLEFSKSKFLYEEYDPELKLWNLLVKFPKDKDTLSLAYEIEI